MVSPSTSLSSSYILAEASSSVELEKTSLSSNDDSANARRQRKEKRRTAILEACDRLDYAKLRELSGERGGFVDDEVRRRVWPVLLRVGSPSQAEANEDDTKGKAKEVEPHRDEGQVLLDVNRSFIHYPAGLSDNDKRQLRDRLQGTIVHVLRRFPSLHYFQGYHDIVTVLLLVLNDDDIVKEATSKMSLHRLRDSLGTGLEPVLAYLRLVQRILVQVDRDMARVVEYTAAIPYFSLSWVLTLLSHDLVSLDVTARLFDFLLAHNPAMMSYVGCAIILMKKDDLAKLDPDSAQDPSMLHHALSKLPNFVIVKDDDKPVEQDNPKSSVPPKHENEALEDSMLSDPDVFLPSDNHDAKDREIETDDLRPRGQPVDIEELIARSLDLWNRHPMSDKSIDVASLLGPKSAVFTWPRSAESLLTDDEAAEIAKQGEDIVVVSEIPEPVVNRVRRRRGRRHTAATGTVLAVVGLAGVLLAFAYSDQVRDAISKSWKEYKR